MSPLSSGTLLLFVLLSPGFFFLFFYYAIGKISREDYQYGIVFDIGSIVSASLFLHIVVGTVYFLLAAELYGFRKFWPIFFEVFISQNYVPLKSNPRFIAWPLLYPFAICSIAGAAGAFFISRIEAGKRSWLRYIGRNITHGAIYDAMFDGQNEVITLASVLTNIERDGRYVTYHGQVVDIVIGAGSKITSVVLKNPQRLLLTLGRGRFYASSIPIDIEMAEDESGTLFIPEANITNAVIIKKTVNPQMLVS
jgi:hypothetical protein